MNAKKALTVALSSSLLLGALASPAAASQTAASAPVPASETTQQDQAQNTLIVSA